MLKIKTPLLVIFLFLLFNGTSIYSQQNKIWTSIDELRIIPMAGASWEKLLAGANKDTSNPDLSNQDDNTNVYTLAAAIVYARLYADGQNTLADTYKTKVIDVLETIVAKGNPGGETLAWAREVGAYAMAADLISYRTDDFESWLSNMANSYIGTDNRTLRTMFEQRPNNWGTSAFGSLCAIYRYLNDLKSLCEIRNYMVQGITGSNSGFDFTHDLSWQDDELNPVIINPVGAEKNGHDIDGLLPEEMRRGGVFQFPPLATNYPWSALQGLVMGARILDRAGMSIWNIGDKAIYRAVYALQIRLENNYPNSGWKAYGDDLWILPFIDEAYGTDFSCGEDTVEDNRMWRHGKNTGWPYVLGGNAIVNCGGITVIDTSGEPSDLTDCSTFSTGSGSEENPFDLYPNPCNGRFVYLTNVPSNIQSIKLFDFYGRQVYRASKLSDPEENRIDFGKQLNDGIYTLVIKTRKGGGTFSEKLIVSK